jgi:hypothetical protein
MKAGAGSRQDRPYPVAAPASRKNLFHVSVYFSMGEKEKDRREALQKVALESQKQRGLRP